MRISARLCLGWAFVRTAECPSRRFSNKMVRRPVHIQTQSVRCASKLTDSLASHLGSLVKQHDHITEKLSSQVFCSFNVTRVE